MFREIRRKDRILDNELAIRLLEEAEYGFLAMSGINGYGYGIPINYVKEGDSIYFHCAPEGYKLECLRENPKVSFTVVGATQIVPGKFTTGYESTIAFGGDHPSQTARQAVSAQLRVRPQTAKGPYFNGGSTNTGVPAS